MAEFSGQRVEQKKDWSLTPPAFHRLLGWLDGGTDSDGQKYLQMRQRLVAYFDRKNCLALDELADETLNRVARRLEEEGVTEGDNPARYCYIVARFVFMEHLRGMQKNEVPLEALLKTPATATLPRSALDDEKVRHEKLMRCLDHCTEKLDPLNRDLIMTYYYGERRVKIENRRGLAARFGLSLNALSIRACRIRNQLEACVDDCTSSQ